MIVRGVRGRTTGRFADSGTGAISLFSPGLALALPLVHAMAPTARPERASFAVHSALLSVAGMPRPPIPRKRIPSLRLLPHLEPSDPHPPLPLPRLQTHLLPPDVLDHLLPQTPRAPRCRRLRPRRVLVSSTARPVVPLRQDHRDPPCRPSRPARDPLPRALSRPPPDPGRACCPRPLRGLHRPPRQRSRDRDRGRGHIALRVRHRSRPAPGKRTPPRPKTRRRDDGACQPFLRREHQTLDSRPDP